MEEKKNEFFNGFDDDILSPEDFVEEEEKSKEKTETDKKEEGKTEEETSKTEKTEKEEGKTTETEVESEDEKAKAKAEAEKNAKFAEMRRQKEAKEKAEKAEKERLAKEAKIKEDAKVEAELGVIKTNPYTDKPIVDESDLKIYKLQKQLEEEGKDPVNDLPSKLAELERQAKAKSEAEANEKAKADKEIADRAKQETSELREKHPELNTAELADDPIWKEVSKDKVGRWSLNEIYELLYLPAKAKADKKSEKEGENKEEIDEHGKKVTKVPSSKSNGGKSSKGYLDMTDEEYLAQEKENNKDFF